MSCHRVPLRQVDLCRRLLERPHIGINEDVNVRACLYVYTGVFVALVQRLSDKYERG